MEKKKSILSKINIFVTVFLPLARWFRQILFIHRDLDRLRIESHQRQLEIQAIVEHHKLMGEKFSAAEALVNEFKRFFALGPTRPYSMEHPGLLGHPRYLEIPEEKEVTGMNGINPENLDQFYYLFENLFRGSEESVAKHQRIYLPYLQPGFEANPGKVFLDFGCGRGEFLKLLQQASVAAKGVDLNGFEIAILKKSGLDVECTDGLEYLRGLPDNTLKGVSSFQVIEHMPYAEVLELAKLAFSKISPGGVLLLETINPLCAVAMNTFYTDPTHIRPISQDALKVYFEFIGFQSVKIILYAPVNTISVFESPLAQYQGYAIVGYKAS